MEQKNKELRNEYINKLARAPFNEILFMLNSLKKQADAFNNSLPKYIENLLDNRINEIKKTNELLDSINIPLKLNKNAPNIEPIKLIPITKNNLQLNDLPKDKIGAISKEYSISDDDYNNIINIIHLVSIMMENTAFTFGSLEEESIRDVLLVSLNSHYERMVTGETFRKRGKTDILIQFENNIAYIGECKIWNGKAQIKKAINQLTSYCSWKDSKTSLIYYSKNKDFKNLINTINEYLDNNENKDIISSKKIKDNMWACKIKKNKNEILDMNLCIYDLYSKKNIKGNN